MTNWSERAISIDQLTVSEAQEYSWLWTTFRLAMPNATDVELARCVSITVGVCPHCYDDPEGSCNCWRDD